MMPKKYEKLVILAIVGLFFLPIRSGQSLLEFYRDGGSFMYLTTLLGLGSLALLYLSILRAKSGTPRTLALLAILTSSLMILSGFLTSEFDLLRAQDSLASATVGEREGLASKYISVGYTAGIYATLGLVTFCLMAAWGGAVYTSSSHKRSRLWLRRIGAVALVTGILLVIKTSHPRRHILHMFCFLCAMGAVLFASKRHNKTPKDRLEENHEQVLSNGGGLAVKVGSALLATLAMGYLQFFVLTAELANAVDVVHSPTRHKLGLSYAQSTHESFVLTLSFLSLLGGLGVIALLPSRASVWSALRHHKTIVCAALAASVLLATMAWRIEAKTAALMVHAERPLLFYRSTKLKLPASRWGLHKAGPYKFAMDARGTLLLDGKPTTLAQFGDQTKSWFASTQGWSTNTKAAKPRTPRKKRNLITLIGAKPRAPRKKRNFITFMGEKNLRMKHLIPAFARLTERYHTIHLHWTISRAKAPFKQSDFPQIPSILPLMMRALTYPTFGTIRIQLTRPRVTRGLTGWSFTRQDEEQPGTPRLLQSMRQGSAFVQLRFGAKGITIISIGKGYRVFPTCPHKQNNINTGCIRTYLQKTKQRFPDEERAYLWFTKESLTTTTTAMVVKVMNTVHGKDLRKPIFSRVKMLLFEAAINRAKKAERKTKKARVR